MWDILRHAWSMPFHISSNFAREAALGVAFAASMGWLSNVAPDGLSYHRRWHITAEGLSALTQWSAQ